MNVSNKTLLESDGDIYKILYETSRDAIMTISPPEWKFTAGNVSTIEMFGAKDESDFVSKAPWEYSPENQPDGTLSSEKAKLMINKAAKEGTAFFEWTHMRLNGEEFPATVLLTRVGEGEGYFIQATVRDITTIKKAELELRDKMEEFEKVNKILITRELKMVELKKEIQELKEEVSQLRIDLTSNQVKG
jgi:PAS domain S-box-containing protein